MSVVIAGCGAFRPEQTEGRLVSDCWGGLSSSIAAEVIPALVRVTYTKRAADMSWESVESIDECELNSQQFSRGDKKLFVGFLSAGGRAPDLFDLKVTDCSSGDEFLNVENVVPKDDSASKLCSAASMEFSTLD